jgi:7-carboxy-7-deazaguanine synthase
MVSKVLASRVKNVCITGGEPLLQMDSVYQLALELISYGCKVSIETNGCVKIPDLYYPKELKFVMDIKCPSSGVSNKNIFDNLMTLRQNDEVKFVISNREDYDFMKRVLRDYPTPAKKLVSPVMSKFSPKCEIGKDLVNWLIIDKMWNVRVQIQMHKCLGVL